MTRLADFYSEFAAVLRSVPEGIEILDSLLLPDNSPDVQVADLLHTAAEISITQKLNSNAYNLDRHDDAESRTSFEGPTLLFHDLKIAFGRLLASVPQDSERYNTLSSLFKFAVDLLLREANRLGLMLNRDLSDSDFVEGDEYLFRVSQGFQTIRTEVQEWNGETFWVTAANGPLFMSASNKAPVDPRPTAAAGSVHTARLLPHIARAPESTMGFVSPLNPRIPQPNYPPTDLLGRFVHPNGHNTLAPVWISGQDAYSTFAPTLDSAGAVVGEQDAANVWSERASEKPKIKFHRTSVTELPTKQSTSPTPASSANASTDQLAQLPANNVGQPQLKLDDSLDITHDVPDDLAEEKMDEDNEVVDVNDVDLHSLLRWTPYNFVDDDELEAAANGSERELVSILLLELQYLQRERLATPGVELEVGDSERHIALKTQNLLSRLVDGAKSENIALRLDTRLPVLMRNYAGSLPAATDPAIHAPFPPQPPQQPQRLQNLGGGAGYRPPGPGRPRGARR